MSARIEVLGLGLMGLSLALALRRAGWDVFGVDPDPVACHRAEEAGVHIGPARSPDWVLAAVPPPALASTLAEASRRGRGPVLLTEITSVKGPVMPLLAALPRRFGVVASHPMAGRELEGGAGAVPDLYQGRLWAAIPVPGREPPRPALGDLVEAVGSELVWVPDAVRHDAAVAVTSHLPYLVALMLSRAAGEVPFGPDLAGPGLLAATRTAESPTGLWSTILEANRTEVAAALGRLLGEATRWKEILEASDETTLRAAVEEARSQTRWRRRFG